MKKHKLKNELFTVLFNLIRIPLILLLSWPISVFGTSTGRTRKGILQIPVRFYQHKKTRRKVILVGVIHIGKLNYYKRIQALIDKVASEGYHILYEAVGKMDEKDIKKLPKKQRVIVYQMISISSFMKDMSIKLFDNNDVVYQKHGLEYPDWWVRTDMDTSQISSLFAEADVSFIEEKNDPDCNFLDDTPKEFVGIIRTIFSSTIKLLPGISLLCSFFNRFNREKRFRNYVIITMRDEIAVKGILQYAETQNVLSIWGAGHLPGIHKHLCAAGYQHTATDWFDAF